jgi:hypothetical protein
MTKSKLIYEAVFDQRFPISVKNTFRFCLLVSLVGLVDGCSFEKQLPIACVSSDRTVVRELCRSYAGRTEVIRKVEALLEHGFNERDADTIYVYSIENATSCRVAVARQCDLIAMRNGIGY